MKRALFFGLLIWILDSTLGFAYEEAGRLPEDWFVAPEDRTQFQRPSNEINGEEVRSNENAVYRRNLKAVDHSIDKIFGSTVSALQSSTDRIGRETPPANHPADWTPWYLKNIIMDIGITGAGTIGVVTASGEISAEVYWQRTQDNLHRLGIHPSDSKDSEETADLVLDDTTTVVELQQSLDPVVKAVMATGRVQNEGKVREGLLKVARELQDTMVNVNKYNPTSSWDISGFRLDVEVSGSGTVSAGVSVGGAVRLRFEWKKVSDNVVGGTVDDENEAARESLRKLLAATAQDLESIQDEHYAATGFDLTGFRLGVGLYAKAKFGVVKGKIKVTGYAFFKRSSLDPEERREHRASIVLPDTLPLVDYEAKEHHLAYAKSEGIAFERYDSDSGAEKVVYYMTRVKFRKGLNKAVSMGARFASRAGALDSNDWEIYKIKPQFALSLQGALPIVTIGGTVALQIEFKR